MTNPRFLIAKYAPDLSRMEPKNIGLLLWHKGRVVTRFLAPNEATFVNELPTYERWVNFWNDLVSHECIDLPGREPVPMRDERCLDALLASQEGNYLLVDAGFVPAKLNLRDMPRAVDYLFSKLVSPIEPIPADDGDARSPSLANQCEMIFDRTGIRVKREQPVECPVYGVKRHLHCNYFIGNGTPRAIFQRARLSSEQSVNSGALTIRALTEAALIQREQCRFLVKRREGATDAAAEGLEFLEKLCGVIDVDDDDAADQVASIAGASAEL